MSAVSMLIQELARGDGRGPRGIGSLRDVPPLRPLMIAALVLLASCETTRNALPTGGERTPARTEPVRAWAIVSGGEAHGFAVRFEEKDGDRFFFSVRNENQQELGLVDSLGRAYRYRPHQEEPEWLGTGTVEEGVRRILELPEGARLEPVAFENLVGPLGG